MRPVIAELARMKAANTRRLVGILLVEHIGDIIACEPIIRQLRAEEPDALILWITKKQYASLVASHPQLDAVLHAETMLEAREIVRSGVLHKHVDLHVNLKPTEVEGLLYPKSWGDPSITASNYFHHGSLLSSLSKGAGLKPFLEAPNIHVPAEAVEAVDELSLPDRFIAVHTTSTTDFKDWSPERWRDLVGHLLDKYDTHVVEVGLRSSIDLDHPCFTSLCGKLSLMQTAEVVRRAAFFIGIDSAPAHMANAWARPGLVMFGKFPSDDFNPFEGYYATHAKDVILRNPGFVRDFLANDVLAALEAGRLWQAAYGSHRRAVEAPQTSYR